MDDSELAYWGKRGRNLSVGDEPLGWYSTGEDIVQLWQVVGEIIERMGIVK